MTPADRLAGIRKGLRKLPFLPGYSQAIVFRRLRELLGEEPATVSEPVLREVESLLAEQRAHTRDWFYWALLLSLFLVLGLIMTGVSLFVERALIL